ncbi:branched-chain amino acid ABC transporter permease [Paucidesulfovibrio longus]|jgi:branched-chain amino acid transport system permease protein|uniref:branched-chain amino acid ABC transporter permease n=1 Tax=Paucidesulfovibrio longus TaxID=889 RepID=UPI0003B651DF|nr:branched-chain amino acid ABC transporter permease [Paucidesulfovibrio longus]
MQGKCGLYFTTYAGERQLFATWTSRGWLAALLLALALLPAYVGTYYVTIVNTVLISVMAAASLNLLTGVCGQISLGHAAFMGVGAYGAAFALTRGVPFIPGVLFGGLCAAVVGMFFGIPSLRLKGIYLAIATLAAQLILQFVFLHWDAVTGGSSGILLQHPVILGFDFDTHEKRYYLFLAATVLVLLLLSNLMRSRFGRAFVAIRDYHLSAEIAGVSLFRFKLYAFAVSSFLAGVAGALLVHRTMKVSLDNFTIDMSISYLAMIIVGGLGSISGAVMGAVFLALLPVGLGMAAGSLSGVFPDITSQIAALKEGVFGLVVILFLIFEPEGLAHRWRLVKAYWKLYPFAH